MVKNLTTGLLILGGLYILINSKKAVASTLPEGKRLLPMVPVIRDSSKTTPIEKSAMEPIQKFPTPQVKKKIMDPYEDFYPSRSLVNPKSISKDQYVSIGGDSHEEMYSRQSGEILPDRDFNLKNVDTNYQDNLYEFVQIGYKPTSGFGGAGLADM
tara:strand:+ start:1953 stop:2420 length:468 start_codon:yes stop_codon:yes gene_type:complete